MPAFEQKTNACTLRIEADGSFSYVSADDATGWKGLALAATIDGRDIRPAVAGIAAGDGRCEVTLTYPGGVSEQVTFRLSSAPATLTIDRVFRHGGGAPVAVGEVRTEPAGDRSGVVIDGAAPGALRVVHVSNLRESAYRSGYRVGPLLCPLPGQVRLIGDSEGHPFPALAIGPAARPDPDLPEAKRPAVLLEAATQQDVFTQMWRLRAQYDPRWTHSIFADYAAIARDGRCQPVTLAAGDERRLGGLFYQIRPAGDLQDLWDDYLAELNRRYDFRGKTSSLLSQAVYCTWNYTFFHDISEEILRTQCAFIAAHLPGIKHFLIDDGYQLPDNNPTYDCGMFYPDPNANVDPVKFPNGMAAVSEMIRSHGLVPSLWWSPAMGRRNRLVAEHPDWLCLDEDGNDWSMDSGAARKAALDFSVPAVREFIEHVLETIFVTWGFAGMKLDFCTYPFDSKDLRFRGGQGVRWWNWFCETIAKFIPPEGIFQVCGGAPYGNPFMGRWADNHRVGGDIGHGEWARHVGVGGAPLPLLAVPGRATLLMDVDSAGIRQDMSDDENLSRLAFCHITQGMMGLGGDLTELSAEQVGWLRRITDATDRGHKVRCPDRRAFTGEPLPDALYVDYPPDSRTAQAGVRKEIAFFNWSDEPTTIGYALTRLGLSGQEQIVDFWTGAPAGFADGQLVASLRPRASRLFQVRA